MLIDAYQPEDVFACVPELADQIDPVLVVAVVGSEVGRADVVVDAVAGLADDRSMLARSSAVASRRPLPRAICSGAGAVGAE